jgi:hypothetical protein
MGLDRFTATAAALPASSVAPSTIVVAVMPLAPVVVVAAVPVATFVVVAAVVAVVVAVVVVRGVRVPRRTALGERRSAGQQHRESKGAGDDRCSHPSRHLLISFWSSCCSFTSS